MAYRHIESDICPVLSHGHGHGDENHIFLYDMIFTWPEMYESLLREILV